jgi:hypothetical protein
MARLVTRRQPSDDVEDFLPVQEHDRQDRTELNQHREDAAWILVTKQPLAEAEVSGGGHREKLRDPLQDTEKSRLNDCWHEAGSGLKA